LDALFTIDEGVDGIHSTAKLTDGIATVAAAVIDVAVQPNQENILDHLNIDSTTSSCTFGISR
jgi:hypothetical protein